MQKHVIKCQIIELAISDQAQAHHLQGEVSRIYRQRLVPLLDQLCSELSAPDQIHRIERLEIDLGRIDPDHLERDLVTKAREALRQALTQEIGQQEKAGQTVEYPQTRSHLELLAFFLRTGSLPWWADGRNPHLLHEALTALIETAPDALRLLFRGLRPVEYPLRRLVQTFADDSLAQLAEILAPSSIEVQADELLAFRQLLIQITPIPTHLLRQRLWLTLFYTFSDPLFGVVKVKANALDPPTSGSQSLSESLALMGQSLGQQPEPVLLYQSLLIQLSEQFNIAYSVLLAKLEAGLQNASSLPEPLQHYIQALLTQEASASAGSLPDPNRTSDGLLDDLSQQKDDIIFGGKGPPTPLEGGITSSPLWGAGEANSPQTTAKASLTQLLAALNPRSPQSHSTQIPPEIIARITALVREILASQQSLSTKQRTLLAELATWQSQGQALELAVVVQKIAEALEMETGLGAEAPDLSFSEADEIVIHNAGLAILWPFLPRFFENLDWLRERRFKDEAAQNRAAGILQYLVHPVELFPEYLLPLNKLLCGLDLATVFDFGPPLTDAEIAQCDPFLEAVIAQVPILKNMSVDGLRGTFLLRQGILSSRDGAWLLRVERETYDIVLDQFPWGWQWVKLPWMARPLRVEW